MNTKHFHALLILLAIMAQVRAQDRPDPLTHEMTPEEELRKHEIGRDFTPTDPPFPPVRMVAEFEQMQSVLIAYPFGIPMTLIKEMADDCKVMTIVANYTEKQQVLAQYQASGVNTANCEWMVAPTDRYWTRDYGPWFVVDENHDVGINDFPYNRPRPNDDNIPVVLAWQMDVPLYGMNIVHTGGNFMCDGLGIGASSELVYEENPALSEEEIDTMVRDYLGLRNYHVLPDPLGEYIKHIDCWGKFLDVDKVLVGQVPSSDWRYEDYEYVASYFAWQTSSYGTPYQVYRIYTPGNYPNTPYTNSLILNRKVFVPITGSQWDDEALQVYEEAMPGYEIIGVMHNTWENTDALHCRAIGIADVGMLYIYHMPLLGDKNFRLSWDLDADVIPYSGLSVISDSLLCFYQFNGGEFHTTALEHVGDYHYKATIPFAAPGTEVGYYLRAADYSGRKQNHPYIGAPDPHVFNVKYASDIILEPDSLVFLTVEEMINGKSFKIYNFTNGDIVISAMENEGMNYFRWYIDPWNLSLPYTMNSIDTLNFNVKISIPVEGMPVQLVSDTLDIYTENSHHQVVIKVDSDLISGILVSGHQSPGSRIVSISPNPFSGKTRILFSLDKPQHARITVHNMQGQLVRLLADGEFVAGDHCVTWAGASVNGDPLPAGIYFIRLVSDYSADSRRMVLVK